MGLVFAIVSAIVTVVLAICIAGADEMSDAPGKSISIWPTLSLGSAVTGLLVWSHYGHWAW